MLYALCSSEHLVKIHSFLIRNSLRARNVSDTYAEQDTKARHRFRRINAPIENGNSWWRGAAKQWIPWWLMSSMVRVMNANCPGAVRLSISFVAMYRVTSGPRPRYCPRSRGKLAPSGRRADRRKCIVDWPPSAAPVTTRRAFLPFFLPFTWPLTTCQG